MAEIISDEVAKLISREAGAMVLALRDFGIASVTPRADCALTSSQLHLAFSIAIEGVRKACVLQYSEDSKQIIFRAADKLVPGSDPENNHPEAKA